MNDQLVGNVSPPAHTPPPGAPVRDDPREMEAGLLVMGSIWEEVLGAGPVGPDDDFFALGGDSLGAIEVLGEVHRWFGRKLPPAALSAAPTCRALAALALTGADSAATPLVALSRGEGRPLFLLPGAGGSLYGFVALLRAAGLGRPAFGVQLPSAASGGDLPGSIEELAARYLGAVRAAQPGGPYHLAGYSFGGRVAVEMARQLAAAGDEVAFLGLFDTYGPGYPRTKPLPGRVVDHLRAWAVLDRAGHRDFLRVRAERVRQRFGGFPPAVPAYIRDDFHYHREVSHRYAPGPYPGRLTLFRATTMPEAIGADYRDPCNGWGGLAGGGVAVHLVPGNHHTLFDEPHVRGLGGALRSCLAQND